MKTVLTIAGFDPSSGAGITADLMVFAAHGLFGTSCITAMTVQNTLGVQSTHAVAVDTVHSMMQCIHKDFPLQGIKIGMLATAEIVSAVASFVEQVRQQGPLIVVLDPVVTSSSGKELLTREGVGALGRELLPLVSWVTPNITELGTLLGGGSISPADRSSAAAELQRMGRELAVVVTGGDLDPPDDLLLTAEAELYTIPGERIQTSSTHGTGCAFSSALLSRLVLGDQPLEAVRAAKRYVAEAMRSASPVGGGHGPLNHLWTLRQDGMGGGCS